MAIFHIRHQLPKSRSTNFYLDRTVRYRGVVCGAEPTEFDVRFKDPGRPWVREPRFNSEEMIPCPACLKARKEMIEKGGVHAR